MCVFLKETDFVHQVFPWYVVCCPECYCFGGTPSHVQTRNWNLRRQEEMHLHGRWV